MKRKYKLNMCNDASNCSRNARKGRNKIHNQLSYNKIYLRPLHKKKIHIFFNALNLDALKVGIDEKNPRNMMLLRNAR